MDFATARKNMIESQIRTNKVVDESILASMADVPRERFVPGAMKPVAYCDDDIAIGGGRCLLEPAVLARLLQEAAIGPADDVLLIGSGLGYTAAVLARVAATVFAQESDPDLSAEAARLFAELGLDNVIPVNGRLVEGCPEHKPYNVIIIEGAVETIPDAIVDQIAEGGRLIAIVQERAVGHATVIARIGDRLSRRVFLDASVPVLPEFRAPARFEF